VSLALEGNQWRRFNPEVPLDDVEDGAIVDIDDVDKIAHLVLVLDPLDALTDHQHTSETALLLMRPFLPNLLAGVEESSHGGAEGSYAAGVGFLWHASLILWYGTYEFLRRKKINLRTRCFFLFYIMMISPNDHVRTKISRPIAWSLETAIEVQVAHIGTNTHPQYGWYRGWITMPFGSMYQLLINSQTIN
jgi:hypothetical protein